MSKKKNNTPAKGTSAAAAKAAAPQPKAEAPADTAPVTDVPAVAAPAAAEPPVEETAPAEEPPTPTVEPPAEGKAPAEEPAAEDAPAPAEETTPAEESVPAEEPAVQSDDQPAAPDDSSAEEEPADTELTADAPAPEAAPPAKEDPTSGEEAPAEEGSIDTSEAETDEETVELPPIDEKRLLDMTRTVQLSVEQIMSNMDDAPAGETGDAPSDEDTADSDDAATVGDVVRDGMSGMAKWLLLVVVFVLVVAGCGIAYLYRSATPDMLPNLRVTFAGQTLEPAAYKWHVPVVGNWFKRTYAETYSSTPTVLEDPVSSMSPDLSISSADYATKLTVTNANKDTVFEGTLSEFSGYAFETTGTYTAKLVASATASHAAGSADITGSETWLFTFDISIDPSIYLSETTIRQGSVAAVRVTGSYEDTTPTLTTTLKNQGFIQSSNGWVCYLPIPWNAPLGTETIDVQVGSYSYTMYLKITDGSFAYKDYSSNSQRAAPYIGQDDAPAKVSKLFTTAPNAISWADAGFVQPFLNRINPTLTFGATEYVGRRYSERGSNTGAGGRTTTNVILSTTRGELVIAPASGKVDLAEDLGDNYGYTLVIDHGAGVRTIFYGLNSINVKAGQQVKQGQTLADCSKTTVVEMRIGTVPIDPIAVWRGQCNGLKYY